MLGISFAGNLVEAINGEGTGPVLPLSLNNVQKEFKHKHAIKCLIWERRPGQASLFQRQLVGAVPRDVSV